MRQAYFEVPSYPGSPEHQERIGRLWNAMRTGDRLVSLRRGLTVLLMLLSAAVLLSARVDGSPAKTAFTLLAGLWTVTLLSIARLVWLERRNDRLTGALLAEVRARPF